MVDEDGITEEMNPDLKFNNLVEEPPKYID